MIKQIRRCSTRIVCDADDAKSQVFKQSSTIPGITWKWNFFSSGFVHIFFSIRHFCSDEQTAFIILTNSARKNIASFLVIKTEYYKIETTPVFSP